MADRTGPEDQGSGDPPSSVRDPLKSRHLLAVSAMWPSILRESPGARAGARRWRTRGAGARGSFIILRHAGSALEQASLGCVRHLAFRLPPDRSPKITGPKRLRGPGSLAPEIRALVKRRDPPGCSGEGIFGLRKSTRDACDYRSPPGPMAIDRRTGGKRNRGLPRGALSELRGPDRVCRAVTVGLLGMRRRLAG